MRHRDTWTQQSRYRNHFPVLQDLSKNVVHVSTSKFGRASATVFYCPGQSSWGMIDSKSAAVLTFYTDPFEPRGHKLRELQIRLTFSDYADPQASRRGNGVYILQRPSPAKIKGGEIVHPVERNWNINPQIPTPMGNISLGGLGGKTNAERKGYWTYESHQDGNYSATWLWTANDANSSANEDTGDLHSGLVLSHVGEDFFVTCTLQGKLVSGNLMEAAREWFRVRSVQRSKDCVMRISPQAGQADLRGAADGLEERVKNLMRTSSATYF